YRLEVGAGVVLGDPDEEAGERHADGRRQPQVPDADELRAARDLERHRLHHIVHDDERYRIEGDEGDDAGSDEALVERGHHVLVAGAGPYEPSADDRGDDGTWFVRARRSEEHTSEIQSHLNLVCRLLL